MTAEVLLSQVAWVRRLACALVSDAADAADVAQQTFADALARPPAHAANLRAWFAQTARNVARRMGRDARLRTERELAAPPPPDVPPAVEAVARAELQRKVVDALLSLDEPYRSTLVLRFFEELEPVALARATGVPAETVRTRVKRGLVLVRMRLLPPALDDERGERRLAALLAPLLDPPLGAAAITLGTKLALAASFVLVVGAATWIGRARAESVHRAPAFSASRERSPATSTAPLAETLARASRSPEAAEVPAPSDPAAPVARLPEEFDLFGIVTDSNGAPVADAWVAVGHANQSPFQDIWDLVSDCIFQRRGGYSIEQMFGSGRCVKSATDGGFRFEGLDGFRCWRIAVLHSSGMALADVGAIDRAARRARAHVVLETGITLRGTIRGPNGDPAEADLWVISLSDGWDCLEQVGSDGVFRLPPLLPPQTLRLSANPGDLLSAKLDLELRAGDAPEREVELVLSEESEPTLDAPLAGRLVGPNGEKADLAHKLFPLLLPWEVGTYDPTVSVVGIAEDMPPRVGGSFDGPSPPRVGGVFDVDLGDHAVVHANGDESLQEDRYELSSREDVRWVAFVVRDRILGCAPVEPDASAPGPDLVVDLSQLPPEPTRGRLRVLLRDQCSGAPITDDGWVHVFIVERGRCTTDASAGNFSGEALVSQVGPGAAIVVGTVEGWMPGCARVTARPGEEPQTVVLELARADARLRGEVTDSGGRPIAGATVAPFLLEDGIAHDFGLDPQRGSTDGAFTLDRVAAVPLLIVARADGYAPAGIEVRAEAAGSPCRIELARGVTVRFRLLAPPSLPAPEFLLRITDRRGVPLYQDWSYKASSGLRHRSPRAAPFDLTLPEGELQCEATIAGAESWTGVIRAHEGAEVVIPVVPRSR